MRLNLDERLAGFWALRSRRERALLLAAALLATLAAVLGLGVLPAWRTLQAAPQQGAQLQAQWQRMQTLQAQAQALQRQPRRTVDETRLRASLADLGPGAQLDIGPSGGELRLQGAPPQALAQWLLQARQTTGAVVREAQLQRVKSTGPTGHDGWSGRLTLHLGR